MKAQPNNSPQNSASLSNNEAYGRFHSSLWSDIRSEESFPNSRPLLAHYTSLEVLESILKNEEVWLSHPLYMNDVEELRFGVHESTAAFLAHEGIARACGPTARLERLRATYEAYFNDFANKKAFDIYVFCLSHFSPPHEDDGLLSMWRGYGANGNGAAIVVDTSQFVAQDNNFPLIIAPIHYATKNERLEWINQKLNTFSEVLTSFHVSDDQLYLAAHALFERFKIFSLFSKHRGFDEEKEWRIAYIGERDTNNILTKMLGYHITPNGIQPKLKLKIKEFKDNMGVPGGLPSLVHKILLGPSLSSPMAQTTVERMLDVIDRPELKERIVASSTPFRAIR